MGGRKLFFIFCKKRNKYNTDMLLKKYFCLLNTMHTGPHFQTRNVLFFVCLFVCFLSFLPEQNATTIAANKEKEEEIKNRKYSTDFEL